MSNLRKGIASFENLAKKLEDFVYDISSRPNRLRRLSGEELYSLRYELKATRIFVDTKVQLQAISFTQLEDALTQDFYSFYLLVENIGLLGISSDDGFKKMDQQQCFSKEELLSSGARISLFVGKFQKSDNGLFNNYIVKKILIYNN